MRKFLLFFIMLSQLYLPAVKAVDSFTIMALGTGLVSVGVDLVREYKKYTQKENDEDNYTIYSNLLKEKNFLSFYAKKLSQKEIGLLHLGFGLISNAAFSQQDGQGELIMLKSMQDQLKYKMDERKVVHQSALNSNANLVQSIEEIVEQKKNPPFLLWSDEIEDELKLLKKTNLEKEEKIGLLQEQLKAKETEKELRINELHEQLKAKDAEIELIKRNQNRPPLPLRSEKQRALEKQIADLQAEINLLKVRRPVVKKRKIFFNRGPLPPIPTESKVKEKDQSILPNSMLLAEIKKGSQLKKSKPTLISPQQVSSNVNLPNTGALPRSVLHKIIETGQKKAGPGLCQLAFNSDNDGSTVWDSSDLVTAVNSINNKKEAVYVEEKTSNQIFEELGVTEDTELTREFFNKNSLQLAHVYSDLTFAQRVSYTSFVKQEKKELEEKTREAQRKERLGEELRNNLNTRRMAQTSAVLDAATSWVED